MKTLSEVKQDIQSAMSGDTFQILLSKGYSIRFTWIKTTSIGSITRIMHKNLYRIQLTEGEFCGHYFKAWIAEIPAMEAQVKYQRHKVNIDKVC